MKIKLFAYKLLTSNYANEDTLKSAGNRIYFKPGISRYCREVYNSEQVIFPEHKPAMSFRKRIQLDWKKIISLQLNLLYLLISSYLITKKNGQITPSEKA